MIDGEYAVIPLTRGMSAIVDVTSMPLVEGINWQSKPGRNTHYAQTTSDGSKRSTLMMHRVVLGLRSNDRRVVDHISGDGLDNRKINLRACTYRQNKICGRRPASRAPYRGVRLHADKPRLKPWSADIRIDGRTRQLGYYATPEDAAWAYDLAAVRYHGEFANCNFIEA